MGELTGCGWPIERLGEAVEQLAERSRFPLRGAIVPAPPPFPALSAPEAFEAWIEAVSAWVGLEVEAVESPHADVSRLLLAAGPAIVRVPGEDAVWAVLGSRGGRVALLGPDRRVRRVAVEAMRAALCSELEAPVQRQVSAWMEEIASSAAGAERATHALVRERLRGAVVGGCWLLRLPPGASFWAQLRTDGLPRRVLVLLAAHTLAVVLGVGGWYMLGRGALEGRLERSWLVAWAFVLFTTIPLNLGASWQQSQVAIGVGKLLKRRLIAGALKLDPEVIRGDGSGQLLGRALEAGAIEGLALSAGFGAALALIEFVVVVFVLSAGPGGPWHAALLVGWAVATLAVGWRAARRSLRWTEARRGLTSDLVEQMVGHRTRIAQQAPAAWHEGEDEALERYHGHSRDMDTAGILLQTLPQAWLVVGLLGLFPSFVSGGSVAMLAVGLGGVMLAGGALGKLGSGLMQISYAAIAWRQVGPLFHAAATPEVHPSPTIAMARLEARAAPPGAAAEVDGLGSTTSPGFVRGTLLDASDLVFSYAGRPEPVIKRASVRIQIGDRLLLEGPSGGGKSTLASLLSGLRPASSGLLLLEGLDFPTVGPAGWRRVVAAAPQYQDNHVLTETFAFNLLMGRRWPPSRADLAEAMELCEALGLGDLIRRMPAGLTQMVGETGWRLSHGERSRLFIARALLQNAGLVVLDESFAALDPVTLEQCLRCVLDRAPALLVIAHP